MWRKALLAVMTAVKCAFAVSDIWLSCSRAAVNRAFSLTECIDACSIFSICNQEQDADGSSLVFDKKKKKGVCQMLIGA